MRHEIEELGITVGSVQERLRRVAARRLQVNEVESMEGTLLMAALAGAVGCALLYRKLRQARAEAASLQEAAAISAARGASALPGTQPSGGLSRWWSSGSGNDACAVM